MKKLRRTIYIIFSFVASSYAFSCPDFDYEFQLKVLSALTPQVLEENPSKDSLQEFFKAMPSRFTCFNRLFGYSDKPAPLYSEPQLHFLFPKIESAVPNEEFTAKLISLAVNATWEADQTGALQNAVHSNLHSQTHIFIEVLETLDPVSQDSVWAFIFGGPHPSNQPITENTQKTLCELSAKSCSLSKSMFSRKVAEEAHH